MKLGNKIYFAYILCFLTPNFSLAEEKIRTTPLINVEKIKPSFEELNNDENDSVSSNQNLKEKKIISLKSSQAILIGLDNKIDSVAYMQVKDLSKSENEQVFIFNGWTFASDPSLTPFDHAIYDLQLLKCSKV